MNIGSDEVKTPAKIVITVTKRTTAKPTISYQIVVTKGLTVVKLDVLNILRKWETASDTEKDLVDAYRSIIKEKVSFTRLFDWIHSFFIVIIID